MTAAIIPAVMLFLAAAMTLILNVFVIVVIARRKRLRTPETMPSSMIYIHLAVVDIIAALLWTLYTALSAANGQWFISDQTVGRALCKQQVYIMGFCNLVNAHTLAALMAERFLKVFKPSKHQQIFFDFVILLFILSIYIFDGLLASYPMWGFGDVSYFANMYQCAVDYEKSTSHFQFTLVIHFALPITLIIAFYLAIIIRVHILKTRYGPGNIIVVEENLNIIGDSYGDRLKDRYKQFEESPIKSTRAKRLKEHNNDGFQIGDEDDYSSSDNENVKQEQNEKDFEKKRRKRKQKKMYYLSKLDMQTTHMYALIAALYFILWIPFIVQGILYTYFFYEIKLSNTFVIATVCMANFVSCCKVPFYLISDKLRAALQKTLGFGRDTQK